MVLDTLKDRAKIALTNVSVEPVFFLFALANGFYLVIAKNLYVDKVCNVNLNYSREICDNIQQHEEEQVEVQKYVSSLQAYNSILQAIPPCIYSLFAGPWSDKHGRKLLIIMSTFGYVFNNAVFMINTHFFYELRAEYLLFECLQDCTGGHVCFYLACYSYIADVSEPENRTKRLALLDGLFPLGFYIGNASSGVIKVRLGYMYNFSLGMLFAIAAMAYTYMVVPDSRPIRDARLARLHGMEMMALDADAEKRIECQEEQAEINMEKKAAAAAVGAVHKEESSETKGNLVKSLFNVKNLQDAWKTLLKKREGHKRLFIILLILAFELEIFLSVGRWNSLFLFFRKHLKWSVVEYSRYTSILGVIGLLAQYIVVPTLSERFKFHDTTISLLDVFTSFINCFVVAFCVNEWMLYIGAVFSVLDSTSTTLFRSLITKNVNPDEVGKIFSIVGTFQALVPFASSPLFGFLYRGTVGFFPAAFLFLVAGLKLIEAIVVLVVFVGVKRDDKKRRRQEMTETKSEMPPLLQSNAQEETKENEKKEEKESKVE